MKRLFISILLLMVATLIFSQDKPDKDETNAHQEIVKPIQVNSVIS